jgi:hypothetical protein
MTEWRPIAGQFLHMCPFTGELLDEHDDAILKCRCFTTPEFLDAQDKRAVEMDSRRGDAGA